MGVPKRLTEMQMKFAHLLVINEGRMTGYECAKEAGYSEDRARITASELQNPKRFPLVVKYIGDSIFLLVFFSQFSHVFNYQWIFSGVL